MASDPVTKPTDPEATLADAGHTRPSGDRQVVVTPFVPEAGALHEDEERYLERGVLGQGGMGEVKCFHDRRIGRDVARKALVEPLAGDRAARRRFVREARVQGQIEHPAVVPVYDLAVEPSGEITFTMKRISGRTLREILGAIAAGDEPTRARFSRRKLLTGLANVCLALEAAHARGIIHRDLKPANVMFGDYGEVYVLDWGIAKVPSDALEEVRLGGPPSSDGQRTGIVGTPSYMAPEQVSGEVDARTDVYALGLILYEILAGRALRNVTTPLQLLFESAKEDPRPSLVAEIPPELDAICARAAARDPAARFPSARALADAIEAYLDGDRDLERRRELASGHAERATKLAEDGNGDAAVDEVMRALALDPENDSAREVLRRLLVAAPARMSPEAEAELRRDHDARRARDIRSAMYGWLAMTIPMPFTAMLGNVKWKWTLLAFFMIANMVLVSWFYSRKERLSRAQVYTYITLAGVATMASSMWLGPFIMLPVSAALMTTLFALGCTRDERTFALVVGTLSGLIPVLAELGGLVPRSTFFEPGRVVLVSRFADVEPQWTLLGLVWTSVAFAPFAGWVAGRLRDALTDAERRLFAHAWQLRRITR